MAKRLFKTEAEAKATAGDHDPNDKFILTFLRVEKAPGGWFVACVNNSTKKVIGYVS